MRIPVVAEGKLGDDRKSLADDSRKGAPRGTPFGGYYWKC